MNILVLSVKIEKLKLLLRDFFTTFVFHLLLVSLSIHIFNNIMYVYLNSIDDAPEINETEIILTMKTAKE